MAVTVKKLLEKMEYQLIQGSLETEVSDIAYDSRKVQPGMLFVAIAGTVADGHAFIPAAVSQGASVLVVEKEVSVRSLSP